jgi:hypothetical protein
MDPDQAKLLHTNKGTPVNRRPFSLPATAG